MYEFLDLKSKLLNLYMCILEVWCCLVELHVLPCPVHGESLPADKKTESMQEEAENFVVVQKDKNHLAHYKNPSVCKYCEIFN